jgi:hypothetical protein
MTNEEQRKLDKLENEASDRADRRYQTSLQAYRQSRKNGF